MFQSFSQLPTDQDDLANRFKGFCDLLERDGLNGYVISHSDVHQSEYLPPDQERLAYLTGFTGSAGWAVVLDGKGYLFVDGRYTEQAGKQSNPACFELVDIMTTSPSAWLDANCGQGKRIGYHGAYVTMTERKRLAKACAKASSELVSCAPDLVDQYWDADNANPRPARDHGRVFLHPVEYAGEPANEKISRVAETIKASGANGALVVQSDSICWALNIRGDEIAHNPLTLAFMLVRASDKPILWLQSSKLDAVVQHYLGDLVELREPVEFNEELQHYAQPERSILVDPAVTADAMREAIETGGASIIEGTDPIVPVKAQKNSTEQMGARRAHLRDGAAMVKFLCWLDEQTAGEISEIEAARKLEQLRKSTALSDKMELLEVSFDTISAAGANAALPHYRVMEHDNAIIEDASLYLVDSGGQYRDGTTDITRTIVVGQVDSDRKNRYTQVLKGHIAVARAKFPEGTSGAQLDPLARLALWNAGCDFGHGTGHGVGSYLCVHEGPARISKAGHVALKPGMILSNEPGYYRPGHFGVRLENLVIVREAKEVEGGDLPVMSFETITLCPFDRRAIRAGLLDEEELAWLNDYHHEVFDKLSHTDLLTPEEVTWLSKATAPILRPGSQN